MYSELIKELKTDEEILSAYPVMSQLRTHLDTKTYLNLVKEAKEKEKYKIFALYKNDTIVSVIGFMPMITLYNGKFIWVCELVTDSKLRSNGFGKKLLSFVHEWANKNDFPIVSLSSGLKRISAHKFYEEKMQYDKLSYVYLKRI